MRIAADRQVFSPRSLNDALAILRRRSNLLIFAGGTHLQTAGAGDAFFNRDLLALHGIEELQRVYRSERLLEIGSMVSLERLSRFDRNIIPQGFREAILSIPHPPVRSIATLGGNLLVHPRYLSTHHYLTLADAQVELRRPGESRWVPVSRLRDASANPVLDGELLTRIRLPMGEWNRQAFRRYYSRETHSDYGFCALAQVQRGILEDIRVAYVFNGLVSYRSRNADSLLVGKKLPLSDRDVRNYLQEFHGKWEQGQGVDLQDQLIRTRLMNLSAWFIHNLAKS